MSKALQSAEYSVMLSPIAAATTARTAALDCQGADYATIIVQVGVEANTNSTNVVLSLTEGDDTNTFVTFDSNFTSITVDNTAATIAPWCVDLKGRKRYLKLTVTPDTTTNGAVLTSAVGVLDPERRSSSLATNQIVG